MSSQHRRPVKTVAIHTESIWRNSRRQKAAREAAVMDARTMTPAVILPSGKFAAPIQHGYPTGSMEYKYIDVANPAVAMNSAVGGLVFLLNGCHVGASVSNRVGRQVMMKSIELRLFNYATSGTGTDQIHRVVLLYDRQANGVAPTLLQVLTDQTPTAPRNLDNRTRFKIFYDYVIPVNGVAEPGSEIIHKFYRKLRHPVQFNGNDNGDVTDIASGSLYMLVFGSNPAGATAGGLGFHARLRFTDN